MRTTFQNNRLQVKAVSFIKDAVWKKDPETVVSPVQPNV